MSQEYVYTFTQVTLNLMRYIQRLVPEVCEDSNTSHEGGSYGLASIHWPYQQIRQVNKYISEIYKSYSESEGVIY